MNCTRLHRWLCISASAACLTICALLIISWSRNQRSRQLAYVRIANHYCEASSLRGRFAVQIIGERFFPGELATRWDALTMPVDKSTEFFSDKTNPFLGFMFSHQVLRLSRTSNVAHWQCTVPCWLPIALSASLATLPWIHLRFSLRTLLIVTTLAAVLLGFMARSR